MWDIFIVDCWKVIVVRTQVSLADLGLKTLKNGKDFCKLKWCCKGMSMNDKRLPFKLVTNEWYKIKCKGHPRRSCRVQVEIVQKELGLQDQVLDIKLILNDLDKRECKESELA